MNPSLDDRSVSQDLGDLFRWVCTKNPFYVISAALVLWGLWVSFGKHEEAMETWLLMSGLAGYTLLLAGTALVLVRYLRVWDDARTVLLLVVLMFLATSVTFDHVLVVEPARGSVINLLGLTLAILISEELLRKIQLRLPPLYRGPYYLILSLFFLYPIFVRQFLDPKNPVYEPMLWGLFGFSTLAGLVFLTLLPAIRRGAEYVRDNGSPWPFPLYPWSLFIVLAVAVLGRAILLCWSLHATGARNYDRLVFGPYFLVPFGFALAVLFLEMALVLRHPLVSRLVLTVPLLLMGLAMVGHHPTDPVYRSLRVLTIPLGSYRAFDEVRVEPDPVYGKFLEIFAARLGADPLFMTLALAAGFYGYAAMRRVTWAPEVLSVALAFMAIVPRNSLSEGLLVPPEPIPLLAPAALQLLVGMRRHNPWNLLFGGICLAGVIGLWAGQPGETLVQFGIFLHLAVLTMLIIGATFSEPRGIVIRRLGVAMIGIMAMAVMNTWVKVPESMLSWGSIVYPLMMGIVLGIYGHFLRDSFTLVIATLILGYWVFRFGWAGYRAVRHLFKGFDYIVSGLGFFMVGLLVSLGKSGVLKRWMESRWGLPWWLRPVTIMPNLATSTDAASAPQQVKEENKPESGNP